VVAFLLFAGLGFAVVEVVYSRGVISSLENYITARGSVGTSATAATLVASGVGAWFLFSPAEAATWGGLPAILGYALGAAAPLLVFIPVGRRIGRVMPKGTP
jgi:sodium/pantothenate symporter